MYRLLKTIKQIVLLVFTVIILETVFIAYVAATEGQVRPAEAIIVLGAAIRTPAINERSLEAASLYSQGQSETVIVSGGTGQGRPISEAQYMKNIIEQHVTSTPEFILEDQSHSTFENIKNSRALLPDASSVILVSDEFHLARAVLLAKRNGFKTVYWSAPEADYYSKRELAYYYSRELVALNAYLPKLIFNR